MENKKTFLGKDYAETKLFPVLSEFLEIIAWDAQHDFPDNFGGLIAYVNSVPSQTHGVNYLWIDREQDLGRNAGELVFKEIAQTKLDHMRESVKSIGVLEAEGYRLIRPDDGKLDRRENHFKLLKPCKELISQVRDVIIKEKVLNGDVLSPNNIFYYPVGGESSSDGPISRHRQSKVWLETINEAYEEAQNRWGIIDPQTDQITKVLALEGMKSIENSLD